MQLHIGLEVPDSMTLPELESLRDTIAERLAGGAGPLVEIGAFAIDLGPKFLQLGPPRRRDKVKAEPRS